LPVNYQLLKKNLHKRSELGISEIMQHKLVHNYNLRGKIMGQEWMHNYDLWGKIMGQEKVQNYNLKGKNLRNITTYKKKISALA
jgi:hypothetical protein